MNHFPGIPQKFPDFYLPTYTYVNNADKQIHEYLGMCAFGVMLGLNYGKSENYFNTGL